MARPKSADSILRNLKKQKFEPKTPIATEMFLPNHSGDHSKGIVNTTPVQDTDLVNKKYVDDNAGGSAAGNDEEVQFNDSGSFGADANLTWDSTNKTLSVENLKINKYGTRNIFLGEETGNFTLTGVDNVGIGYQALKALTDGQANLGIGKQALSGVTTGDNNVGIGATALRALTTATRNVAIGTNAGDAITTAASNVLIGYDAGSAMTTTGNNNVFIGDEAGVLATSGSYYNVGIGSQSCRNPANADGNICIGYRAGKATGSAHNTVLIGYYAGEECTANFNICIGREAGKYIDGVSNVAMGYQAMLGVNGSTTGTDNTCIGEKTGTALTSGSSNVFIGHDAGSQETTGSNKLFIENTNTATPLIYGEFDNDLIKINGNLYIATVKSGATQVGAGAAADEIWKTSSHATLPDNVLMIGV